MKEFHLRDALPSRAIGTVASPNLSARQGISTLRHAHTLKNIGGSRLSAVRETCRLGIASYPLSWIHYFETYRKRDPAARRRLGEFMAEISDFHSMAGAGDLLGDEVVAAVERLRGRPNPHASSRVFGRGYAHAFGKPDVDLSEEPFRNPSCTVRSRDSTQHARTRDATWARRDAAARRHPGSAAHRFATSAEREVENNLTIHGRSGDMANRIVLAQEGLDLARHVPEDLLPEGTTQSGIPKSRKVLTDLILSMPAKGTITRMRMTAHQNPQFAWAIGDLNDMMALGTAAAYCEIVVAEKKWGDVLQRHRKHTRATVITDIAGLPNALASAAAD